MRPATSSVRTTAGHRLHVEVWEPADGADEQVDVLLVHGLSSNLRLWDGVAVLLVDAGHRVVTVDQRGHGRSERAADGDMGYAAVVADLVDVITATGLDRPVVVGQSWGGNVMLELADHEPERVRGVVGVDGGFFDPGRTFASTEAALEALAPPVLDGLHVDDLLARIGDRMDDWPPGAVAAQLANLVLRPDGTIEPALRREDHLRVVEAMVAQRPLEVAARIRVPVLLLPAVDGDEPPPERAGMVDAVAAALADGTVRWCLHSAHDVHLQRPALVVDHLRAWIDEVTARA